jgi:hypothetical protein
MNEFKDDVKKFLVTGEFTNNLDSYGNIELLSIPVYASQRYVSIEFKNYVYDQSKIESLYDVNINEILLSLPVSSSTSNVATPAPDVNNLIAENTQLKSDLTQLIEKSNNSSATADIIAAKKTIISLRIALGEGTSESDFSDVFPYTKL